MLSFLQYNIESNIFSLFVSDFIVYTQLISKKKDGKKCLSPWLKESIKDIFTGVY